MRNLMKFSAVFYLSKIIGVVALLGTRNKDTRKELNKTNILTKNSSTTYTNEMVNSETVSVRLPGLSAEILPSF